MTLRPRRRPQKLGPRSLIQIASSCVVDWLAGCFCMYPRTAAAATTLRCEDAYKLVGLVRSRYARTSACTLTLHSIMSILVDIPVVGTHAHHHGSHRQTHQGSLIKQARIVCWLLFTLSVCVRVHTIQSHLSIHPQAHTHHRNTFWLIGVLIIGCNQALPG